MSHYTLRYTSHFSDNLKRIFQYVVDRDHDLLFAEYILEEITKSLNQLADFPYNYRKIDDNISELREIIIPFGKTGYIAMFKIQSDHIITLLAIRHQLEDDYF